MNAAWRLWRGDTRGTLFYETPLSFSGMTQKLHWELVLLGFGGKISPFKLSLSQILWINIISHEQHKMVCCCCCMVFFLGRWEQILCYVGQTKVEFSQGPAWETNELVWLLTEHGLGVIYRSMGDHREAMPMATFPYLQRQSLFPFT